MPLDAEIASLIADAPLSAHLATSVDDRPHVAPVWYIYEDSEAYRAASDDDPESDRLWILTGGKKLANLRRNPRVALSIERADASGVDWAVQLLGTARIVDDDSRVEAVESAMDRTYRSNVSTADETATDGGTGSTIEDPDQGDSVSDTGEWALVAVRIGSATAQRY